MFLDSFSGTRISKLFVYFSGQDKHLRRHAVYTQRQKNWNNPRAQDAKHHQKEPSNSSLGLGIPT